MNEPRSTSAERTARFDLLVDSLRPLLQRASPEESEETVLESAVELAAYRLAGGNIFWSVVG